MLCCREVDDDESLKNIHIINFNAKEILKQVTYSDEYIPHRRVNVL